MSGTSLDAVDAAMILTDGEKVAEFGPAVERKYTPAERAVLQAATDAARAWNWNGPVPEAPFRAALEVISRTHFEAWQMLTGPERAIRPALAGVHGQTLLHRRAKPGAKGATLQLIDPFGLQKAFGVPMVCDFRTADVEAGGRARRWRPPTTPR